MGQIIAPDEALPHHPDRHTAQFIAKVARI
jgi:hypothetical protein